MAMGECRAFSRVPAGSLSSSAAWPMT